MTKEVRKLKVLFNKAGGNASKSAQTTRISLPIKWVKEMGLTPDNREVKTSFDGQKITIEIYEEEE